MLSRRSVLALGAALACYTRLGLTGTSAAVASPPRPGAVPFRPEMVRLRAQELAAAPYQAPVSVLPEKLARLSYDQYRDIRFRAESATWQGSARPFQLQFFHLGFGYRVPVALNIVTDGQSQRVLMDPAMFDYGPLIAEPPETVEDLGFSGFRVHNPINRSDYFDEFLVFQGASYFRAVAASQNYGLSARGLAIDTAEPSGEEFPEFREFWIEDPADSASELVVYALLDSPSTTGAYRFRIRPGSSTVMDVEATLFPRKTIENVGIAPLTSMYFFGPQDRVGVDDFRSAVHDSDGLLIWNGNGEAIWRPLLNPDTLQVSAFMDQRPRGFGLMQREREFGNYQDLEARYERRPSLWVEPVGEWGAGSVMLVEIPTDSEANDNIVAFWRPKDALQKGTAHQFAYRLHWGDGPPARIGLARIRRTMTGLAGAGTSVHEITSRNFVIDFAGDGLNGLSLDEIEAAVTATGGHVKSTVVKSAPELRGIRVAIELEPQDETVIELRCQLLRSGAPISEVWMHRWLA